MYFGEYIAAGHDLSPSQPVVLVYPEMIAENWRRLNERDGAAGRDAVLPGGWPGRMAVIKADAYGHGLIPAARALLKAGAAAFGVGTVSEGAALTRALPELREKHCRILPLLGVQSPEEALSALSHGLTPMIHRLGQAAMLDAALREAPSLLRAGFPLDVAVKVDTGLCRLGPDRESLAALLEELRLFPALRPGLLLSHFACSDVPEKLHTVAGQIAAFMEILAAFRERWPEITPSLANSAAYLKPEMFPKELGPQMGRPGICLYGGNPFAGTNQEEHGRGFIPAMELAAPILDYPRRGLGQLRVYVHRFPILTSGHTGRRIRRCLQSPVIQPGVLLHQRPSRPVARQNLHANARGRGQPYTGLQAGRHGLAARRPGTGSP